MNGKIQIALDAMGGDRGPEVNLEGAYQALMADPDFSLFLVGDEKILKDFQNHPNQKSRWAKISTRWEIVHAEESVSMEDHATRGLRSKKRTSIQVAMELVKEGRAQAFLSAGHSGAVMASALLTLGRLSDVERPAIVVQMPSSEGSVTILDAGANVDCKASHLCQFAEMGDVYARVLMGIQKPRVGLLSNGSESHKGNELTRTVDLELKKNPKLNYIGYIEGYDVFAGVADVVVCDGFVGNITLKLAEGLAETAFRWFRNEIRKDILGILGVLLMKRVLSKFRARFDCQPYGAAPLLGVKGMVMISHGSSTAIAIKNGLVNAKIAVKEGFVDKIAKSFQKHPALGDQS